MRIWHAAIGMWLLSVISLSFGFYYDDNGAKILAGLWVAISAGLALVALFGGDNE